MSYVILYTVLYFISLLVLVFSLCSKSITNKERYWVLGMVFVLMVLKNFAVINYTNSTISEQNTQIIELLQQQQTFEQVLEGVTQ